MRSRVCRPGEGTRYPRINASPSMPATSKSLEHVTQESCDIYSSAENLVLFSSRRQYHGRESREAPPHPVSSSAEVLTGSITTDRHCTRGQGRTWGGDRGSAATLSTAVAAGSSVYNAHSIEHDAGASLMRKQSRSLGNVSTLRLTTQPSTCGCGKKAKKHK